MAIHAAGCVDSADAVKLKVVVGGFSVGSHEELYARILIYVGVVLVVDRAQIVAPCEEVDVDLCVGCAMVKAVSGR